MYGKEQLLSRIVDHRAVITVIGLGPGSRRLRDDRHRSLGVRLAGRVRRSAGRWSTPDTWHVEQMKTILVAGSAGFIGADQRIAAGRRTQRRGYRQPERCLRRPSERLAAGAASARPEFSSTGSILPTAPRPACSVQPAGVRRLINLAARAGVRYSVDNPGFISRPTRPAR